MVGVGATNVEFRGLFFFGGFVEISGRNWIFQNNFVRKYLT